MLSNAKTACVDMISNAKFIREVVSIDLRKRVSKNPVSELARTVGPLCDMTPDALRLRPQRLYAVPELVKLGMIGRHTAHTDSAFAANATTAGMLTLTAMLAGPPKTIGERVLRLWRARYIENDVRPLPARSPRRPPSATRSSGYWRAPSSAPVSILSSSGRESGGFVGLAWVDRPYQPVTVSPGGAPGYRRTIAAYVNTPKIDRPGPATGWRYAPGRGAD